MFRVSREVSGPVVLHVALVNVLAAFADGARGNLRVVGESQQEIGKGRTGAGAALRILRVDAGEIEVGPGLQRGVGVQRHLLEVDAEFQRVAAVHPRKIVVDLNCAALFVDRKIAGTGGRRGQISRAGGAQRRNAGNGERRQPLHDRDVGRADDSVLIEQPRAS